LSGGYCRWIGLMATLGSILLPISSATAQSLESFVKAGPVFAVDNGFFANTNTGWTITGGLRQPITPSREPSYLFVDLGGSYLSLTGSDHPVVTAGAVQVFSPITGQAQTTAVSDLQFTELREIRRASLDAAIGWTTNPSNSVVHTWVRGGGRYGHIHGLFNSRNTATTNNLIQNAQPGSAVSVLSNFDKNDTFGGLFVSGGIDATLTEIDSLALGNIFVSVGVDGEFGVDWIDFDGFGDDQILTAAVRFTATIHY